MNCPAPLAIERLYWSTRDGAPVAADRDLHAHVASCDVCTAQIDEIERLATAGKRLEPSTWTRQEAVRTALLANAALEKSPAPKRSWKWTWFAPVALAAAGIGLVMYWPSRVERSGNELESRVVILDHGSTRHLVVAPGPDEIVRLADGAATIVVGPLRVEERFRLFTGDGSIEARDAAFDVTVNGDRLVSVRALRGTTTVNVASFQKVLDAGETWRQGSEVAITDAPAPTVASRVDTKPAPLAPAPAIVDVAPAPLRLTKRRSPPSPAPESVALHVEEPAALVEAKPDSSLAPPAPRTMTQRAFDDGWAALRANDFDTAATAFARAAAVTTDPRMIEDATYWQGVALGRGGKLERAEHVFVAFLTTYVDSPRTGEVSAMVGWIMVERGDLSGATQRFEVAQRSPSREVRDSAAAGLRVTARRAQGSR